MRETDFIARNKDKWSKYETTLKRDQQDPDLLSELYVHTTEDLSYSRTFYPNRSVRVYLNGLARRTFLQLYRNRRGEGRRFLTFWTDELPRVLYARRRALLISLIIFTIAIAIGVVSFLIDGAFAELILGQQYVDQTREFIRSGDPMQVYKQRSPFEMFLTITFNNIFVALQAFIMGAFFSVGTVVILINNGVMLGVFQYFFVDQGLFRESFLTIWIHGALEISSIVIAGGAGLVMGSGLLFPGTYSRLQAFSRSARDGLKIMIGTIPLFIIAGFLEGYLTRHTEVPDVIRFFFIFSCFGFILWYYWYFPRQVVQRSSATPMDRVRKSAVDNRPIILDRIKMLGEVMTDTFTLLRRTGARLFAGLMVVSLLYCLLVFGFTDESPSGRFVYSGIFFWGAFYNLYALTSTLGFERDLTFFCSVFISMYGVLFLVYRNFAQYLLSSRKVTRRALLQLLLPVLLITFCFSLPKGWPLLANFLLLPFLLTYAYLAYHNGLTETAGLQSSQANDNSKSTVSSDDVTVVPANVGAPGMATLNRHQAAFATAFRYTYTRLASNYALFLLLLFLGIFTLFILDTAVGNLIFTALNWVFTSDQFALYEYNTMIQTLLYWTYFSLLLAIWASSLALNFHSLREQEEATGLRANIQQVGTQKKLRGLELE